MKARNLESIKKLCKYKHPEPLIRWKGGLAACTRRISGRIPQNKNIIEDQHPETLIHVSKGGSGGFIFRGMSSEALENRNIIED